MKHLLIVDDEPFVRDALKRVLEGQSVTVYTADGAEAALNQLRRQVADVVIVDVIMQGMDGVQLIKRLRVEYPAVRIVAISGGGNFELSGYRPEAVSTRAYLAAAMNAGADAALAKPFDTAELEAAIRPLMEPPVPPRAVN